MKKFYSFLFAAVALVGFAACNQDFTENVAPENGEMVSFKATIADETRVGLDGLKTVWVAGDKVMVDEYEFICQSDLETFVCTQPGCSELLSEEYGLVTAVYAGQFNESNEGIVDSKKGSAGAVLEATGSLEEGLSFEIKSAFLKFTTTSEKVSLKIADGSDAIFSHSPILVDDLTPENGVYYVAIEPGTATLYYEVDGVEANRIENKTFEAGKIYNLGFLGLKSEYGVVGSFQGWDVAVGKPVTMYTEGDWAVAYGIELYKTDEIKIVKGNSWDVNYGLSAAGVVKLDEEESVTKGGQNMKVAKNGKFDISFNATTKKIKVVCVEEYTDLQVNITINNKAGWNPLYIVLKDGDNLLTAAAGDPVTGNTYAVSGDYIGSALSYQFISGSKKTEPAFVTITKDGATVTLEEKVVKFEFKLNTDNSKKWWGDNTYIYVWNSGTSMDNTWPGTKMTNDGNYTWHINIPSDVVGKKINYIINNGGSWQSPNQENVLIPETGLIVEGSKIGIN